MDNPLSLSKHNKAILKITQSNIDFGPNPHSFNLKNQSILNEKNFFPIWTGNHLKITLFSLEPNNEVGITRKTLCDQFFYLESGYGIARIGEWSHDLHIEYYISNNDTLAIPANCWYNIINTGLSPLKGFLISAPSIENIPNEKQTFKLSEQK